MPDEIEAVGAPAGPVQGPVVEAPDAPGFRTLPHQQEAARRRIAYALIGIFAFEVLFALIANFFLGMSITDIKEVMLIVFGPTGALVGSATGFYFGTKTTEDESSSSQP